MTDGRKRHTGPARRRRIAAIAIAVVVELGAGGGRPAGAHSPHDVVADVQFVADHEASGRVFASVRGRLMRSVDGGTGWTELVNAPGGEHDHLAAFALAPSGPAIVYAASEGGVFARSVDGGDSWTRRAPPPIGGSRLVVSPVDADVVFAVDPVDGGAVTVDGGDTWQPFDHHAVVLDVDRTGRVLTATADGRIRSSTDDGRSWDELGAVRPDGRPSVLRVHATGDGGTVVLVGTTRGQLFRSLVDGAGFEQVGAGLPTQAIMSITAVVGDGTVLWAVTWADGPFRSTDLGVSWTASATGATIDAQAAERRKPNWNVVAAPAQGPVLLGGFDGLFVLDEEDLVWRAVETLDGYLTGLAVSPAFADDGVVIVMSYVRGAFRSTDGGGTWALANDGLVRGDGDGTVPLRRLHNVRMSPAFDRDGVVFGATWTHVLRSRDGGRSWTQIRLPPSPDGRGIRQFVLAVSPGFVDDRTVFAGTRQGSLYRSVAGGDPGTWELIAELPERIRSIATGPDFPADPTVVVGGTTMVFSSDDGGDSWAESRFAAADGTSGHSLSGPGVQVAVSPELTTDRTVLAAVGPALHVSHDGAETWAPIDGLGAGSQVEAVAFSPEYGRDGTILVSVRGVGLLRSDDRGTTFAPIAPALIGRNLLIADYAHPTSSPIQFSPTYGVDRTIFATAGASLLRSTDGGTTWEPLGLPSTDVVRAAVDLTPSRSPGSLAILLGGLGAILWLMVSVMVDRRASAAAPTGAGTDRVR